jgi:5-methyltetrahydrofolate--homocysteine methyltransferase
MPRRQLLNRTFLALAAQAGLDAALLDPLDGELMGTLLAAELLLGRDPWCQAYTRAFREGRLGGRKE